MSLKRITIEETNWMGKSAMAYVEGYNTAIDIANTEIDGLQNYIVELIRDRDGWKNCAEKFESLHKCYNPELDPYSPHAKWAGTTKNFQSVVSPEMKDLLSKPDLTDNISLIQGLIKRIEKVESNQENAYTNLLSVNLTKWSNRIVTLEQWVEKVEQNAIMDGEIIKDADGFPFLITKIIK